MTATPLQTDIKSVTAAFNQLTTGVGVQADVPARKIDGSF
jgi:hypothetical protein